MRSKKETILVLGEPGSDLEKLTRETPGTRFIAVPGGLYPRILTGFKLGKELKTAPQHHLILPDRVEGYLLALWGHFRYRKSYDLWVEENRELPRSITLLRRAAIYFSKQLITRSKQLRFTLQQKGKEIRVIYPWIIEAPFQKRELSPPYKLYINHLFSAGDLLQNRDWKQCPVMEDADLILLDLNTAPLNGPLPEIVFQAVATRRPVVLLHRKPKKLNKRFGGISTVFTTDQTGLTIDLLNDLVGKNIPLTIPKRYRFRYNLSLFKKILKTELPTDQK